MIAIIKIISVIEVILAGFNWLLVVTLITLFMVGAYGEGLDYDRSVSTTILSLVFLVLVAGLTLWLANQFRAGIMTRDEGKIWTWFKIQLIVCMSFLFIATVITIKNPKYLLEISLPTICITIYRIWTLSLAFGFVKFVKEGRLEDPQIT